MIGPLIRALISMYGPSIMKTVVAAAKKTLDSNIYIEAGHNPARDFKEFLNPGAETSRKMSINEAKLVLGVQKGTAKEVEESYEKLFKLNDPAKGGSFYLQCKLMGAKETLAKKSK